MGLYNRSMPDLFHEQATGRREAVRPLADRMRPRSLSEFVGQETIIGPGSVLRRMMAADRIPSVILWGSPGTGKTALAGVIDLAVAEESMQRKAVRYDGQGHYDCASALIKSTGGSDPDAAIYWLACMFAGGEDPRFIARRLSILASEDIGLAEPRAMEQAAAAWHITERIGMPECQFALSQLTIFLANAPKSNAAAQAIWHAMDDVEHQRTVPVPKHLAGSGGEGYRNPHKEDAADQVYLGVDRTYWNPEA